jgi:signal transduction histidine kinase
LLEGPIPHQLPLFILFAAGLFAAVNNHQLPQILYARLFIYGFSFLFIPIYDLIVVRPPLASLLWLQLATVLFVLYFVIECAQIFLQIYRKGLDQLDALRQERDSARSAYKVKSQFVSIISHELRTPLTSIAGSLDLLHSGAFEHSPEKSRRVLDIARKNSNRLRVLIDDLLDFQKLETSGLKHTFQSLDLNQLVRDVMMSMVPAAEKKEVSLVAALSDRPLPVVADRDRLMQLFFNLLSNAIKFSKGPSDVTVKTWVERGCVYTAIEDHGIGIPEGSEELVFSQFGQVDSSDHRQHEGTGLGLTIVRQITEAHNGSIQYSSVLNAGTTFTLRLPLSGKEQKSTFRDD